LSVANANLLSHVPVWYIQGNNGVRGHACNGQRPSYGRMRAAGNNAVRLSIFTHIGGTELPNQWMLNTIEEPGYPEYWYQQHWSWVMVLNNMISQPYLAGMRVNLVSGTTYNDFAYGQTYANETIMDWLFNQVLPSP
ncbi:MAG: hypothetical protein FWD05_06600, partial [Oscillospiraceae bacterium]|nr:hypothetical protein [Oscillospiraceae bacterium]